MQNNRIITTTVLQLEAVECGAASLSMILMYYGKFLPLEKIREDCNVNRDGSSASNIVKAGINYGLKAKGFKNDIDILLKQKFPVIIHWNFNHFLVLEGYKKDKIYLNDPAVGHRTVTKQELGKSFTGIVLTFEPTKEFVKSGRKSNLWLYLFERIKGYEKILAFLVLVGLLLVLPGLVIPVFIKFLLMIY
jgi:ABC-type bacteriocin/lantibiotic exporter with double-glycine peptidase domain